MALPPRDLRELRREREAGARLYAPGRASLVVQVPSSPELVRSMPGVYGRQLPIRKAAPEEQYFLAVVLEPTPQESPDLHGHFYTEQTIRAAMFSFMANLLRGGGISVDHTRQRSDAIRLVESYQARTSWQEPGGPVQKGSWLIGCLVPDRSTWQDVKAGDYGGVSIDGTADFYEAPRR